MLGQALHMEEYQGGLFTLDWVSLAQAWLEYRANTVRRGNTGTLGKVHGIVRTMWRRIVHAQGHEGQLLERKYCKTLGHGDAPSNTKTRRYCKAREY